MGSMVSTDAQALNNMYQNENYNTQNILSSQGQLLPKAVSGQDFKNLLEKSRGSAATQIENFKSNANMLVIPKTLPAAKRDNSCDGKSLRFGINLISTLQHNCSRNLPELKLEKS